MSADEGRSAPERVIDKAAWGCILAFTAAFIAAGWASKKVLDVLDARDERKRQRKEGAES